MRLTFLGKATTGGQSPTLYATDQESYVVQGWIMSDGDLVSGLGLPAGESVVEVPPRLMGYLANDGLPGEVTTIAPPVVYVNEKGNYLVRGREVREAEVLSQMDIPDHESCVEVPREDLRKLVDRA
ncbi:MAG: hypothetical protein HKP61_00895 [Dactylosporangium sp.]|nr:hypothetical protein [Dactylosporangium sp.]NNJ59527.1 hypothetical protein [Dactylosporangium sp.]